MERIANKTLPPLSLTEIIEARVKSVVSGNSEASLKSLRDDLKPMAVAFKTRGDLQSWSPLVLDKIDECFLGTYKPDGKVLSPYLFFPNSAESQTVFLRYCEGVDKVLRANADYAPPYAREYFAFYSISMMHGFNVPMPLGTQSVIVALDGLLKGVNSGFVEVSDPVPRHSPRYPSPAASRLTSY